MAALVDFKNDPRISSLQREALREFASEIGGDILGLATRLGLVVHFAELPLCEAGFIEYAPTADSPSGYRITVNALHSATRQRFTVAHEIGHFVLHHRDGELRYRTETKHRLTFKAGYEERHVDSEYEADQFAAALLMPPAKVRAKALSGVFDVDTLSRIFGVSREAMTLRLKQLELEPVRFGPKSRQRRMADPYGLLGWNVKGITEQGGAAL